MELEVGAVMPPQRRRQTPITDDEVIVAIDECLQ